jgi:membrane associated rhomboid family serine protease
MSSGYSRITARLTFAVKWLIGLEIAVFLITLFAGRENQLTMAHWLVLTPAALLEGHVWKLLTTAVFPLSPLQVIIDVLILWFMMPHVERDWGTRRFVRFAVVTVLVGSLAGSALGLLLGGVYAHQPIAGLSPFIFAAIIAQGTQYAHQQVSLFGIVQMKGKTLAIGFAVLVVVQMLFTRAWTVGAANIAAAIAGWVMVTGHFTPQLWILRWRRARLRRRYTVLDGGARRRDEKKWLN